MTEVAFSIQSKDKKIERSFLVLTSILFSALLVCFAIHVSELIEYPSSTSGVVESFLFYIFVIASAYFFFYVVLTFIFVDEFFESTTRLKLPILFVLFFAPILTALVMYGTFIKLGGGPWGTEDVSLLKITHPSFILAILTTIFDLNLIRFPGFRWMNLRVKEKWRQIFIEATKVDLVVLLIFVFLTSISVLIDYRVDKPQRFLDFIAGGEGFVLFMANMLFGVEIFYEKYFSTLD